ncbi:EAL domain-containing protein [Burkholderiaceae bacterium DAT-1]|nr:EAL domain-containing protein [Burkholderiaceae bacterium DAT-1]
MAIPRLPFFKHLLVVLALGLSIQLASAFVTLRGAWDNVTLFSEIIGQHHRQVEMAEAIQNSFKSQVQAWKDLLLYSNDHHLQEQYWTAFLSQEAAVATQSQQLLAELDDEDARNHLNDFMVLHQQAGNAYRQTFATLHADQNALQEQRTINLDRAPAARLSSLNDELNAHADEAGRAGMEKSVQALNLAGLMLCLSIVASSLLYFFLGRKILRILGGDPHQIRDIVIKLAHGDLQVPIEVVESDRESLLSAIKQMAEQMSEAFTQQRIAAVAFESGDGIAIMDEHFHILRVNRSYTRITGYMPGDVIGQTATELDHIRLHSGEFQRLRSIREREGSWLQEVLYRRKDGSESPMIMSVSSVINDQGRITHLVATLSDISEQKKALAQIHELAYFDQLTHLPNRTLLQNRLTQAMARSARNGHFGAVLLLDLDHFKLLNDMHGHEHGDRLLTSVAEKMNATIRQVDTVARLGGDEFVILLEHLGQDGQTAAEQAGIVANKLLDAIGCEFHLGDVVHRNTASIGISLFLGAETRQDELFKQADLAMYRSKEAGRNRYHFFDKTMEVAIAHRVEIENDLRRAIKHDELALHYQAQVNEAGDIVGVEALLRWHHPVRGLVPPMEFIPIAEATGLIGDLGEWVITEACKQLNHWDNDPLLNHVVIAVNVSALQFGQTDFVDRVASIVHATGARSGKLKIELTESALANDIDEVIEKMHGLRALGISISLDDFGTGYSSLSYLKRLPIDQLKIDRSFVRDILTDSNDEVIAKAIVSLANSLGLNAIAEGVESEAQRQLLLEVGCSHYQGYLFSKPAPAAHLERAVRRTHSSKDDDDVAVAVG